jgi:hypothetical protein
MTRAAIAAVLALSACAEPASMPIADLAPVAEVFSTQPQHPTAPGCDGASLPIFAGPLNIVGYVCRQQITGDALDALGGVL